MPQRTMIDFDTFKSTFMDNPSGGYYPVYAYWDDDPPSVNIDLICEWRLPDGKVRFLSVVTQDRAQVEQIKEYLAKGADLLKDVIVRTANAL